MNRNRNKELAELFRLTAVMIEILEDNVFRARAFDRAATTIEGIEEDICNLATGGEIEALPGIGKALSRHIINWCRHGTFDEYEKLKETFPPGLLEVLQIPGLGPKKVRSLYTELGITSLGELEYACLENRLIGIKGFGLKTQQKILSAIEERRKIAKFRHAPEAYKLAEEFADLLKSLPGVRNVKLVGALRRFEEYTDDIDLLVDADSSEWIETLAAGKIKSGKSPLLESFSASRDELGRVRVRGVFENMAVDIRQTWGAGAFFVYTGNRAHVEAVLSLGALQGLTARELLAGDFRDESEIYRHFGLSFIPPELREGMEEIDAARNGVVPVLITEKDIRGIFHVHTTSSDGSLSLERVVSLCVESGYEYVGISDHSVSAAYAGGLTEEKLKRQREEIESLRERYPQIDIYWGIESDIRPDGALDYPDHILEAFDFVIGSVHSHFKMDRSAMTERILKAMRHPCLTMLGHPTGRLILARAGYELDVDAVLETAKEHRKIVELNAHPYRLDLNWINCKKAKALGVPISINPDAHNVEDFSLRYGIFAARKGWLTVNDVWNAKTREEMRRLMMEKPWRK